MNELPTHDTYHKRAEAVTVCDKRAEATGSTYFVMSREKMNWFKVRCAGYWDADIYTDYHIDYVAFGEVAA